VKFTFDDSRVYECIFEPGRYVPSFSYKNALFEFAVSLNREFPTLSSPCGFWKWKTGICPNATLFVLENQIEWNGTITVKDPNGNIINNVNNTFTFNDKGSLISPTTVTLSSPQNIDINLKDLTSYSKSNSNGYTFSQDGIAKGYLKEYNIVDDGTIYADFSNTKSVALGQIPVFHFQNPQGLESVGNSLFRETANSNKAFLYEKDGTYLPGSKIHSYTIETSNVNFTQAMTELIVNQKAYSAAAKTITTSDQMIQKAINMKT